MSENGGNKGSNLNEDLSKMLKMGVGAVAGVVEKGVQFVQELTTEGTQTNKRAAELGDQLSRKGGEALDKTKAFGGQLKDKLVSTMNAAPQDLSGWLCALDMLADDELKAIKDKIEAVLGARDQDGGQVQ